MGCVRTASRERSLKGRAGPARVDAEQHRPHEEPDAAAGLRARLEPRNRQLRAGILSLESVVFSEDVRARPGLPQRSPVELVSRMLHRPGKRTGGKRLLLAA